MSQTADGSIPARKRWSEQRRAERRREFLDAARAIVNTDGLTALTMQRVTSSVGASEGTIYNYFDTKDSLLAEMQVEALEVMSLSFQEAQRRLDSRLANMGAEDDFAALAGAVASVRFFVAAEATLPNEIELSRRIFTQPTALGDVQASRVVPAGLGFLQLGVTRLERAAEVGVLDPGNSPQRALLALASVVGTLLTGRLGTWDATLFDSRALTLELISHLVSGWGASPELYGQVAALLDSLSDEELAPPGP